MEIWERGERREDNRLAEGDEVDEAEVEETDRGREKRRGLLEGKESGGFFAEFSTSGGNRVEEKRRMSPAKME